MTAGLLAAVPALPAAAAGPCDTATLTSWTGTAGDGAWANPGNWTAGVPSTTSNVILETPSTPITGAAGSVCDLTLTGGTAEGTELRLTGAVSVTDDASVNGRVVLGGGSTLTVTDLLLLGPDAALSAETGEAVAPVQVVVDGTLRPTGTVAAVTGTGLHVRGSEAAPAKVDVNGAALTVSSPLGTQFGQGASVVDTKPGGTGVLGLEGGGPVTLPGTLTVTSPATLRVRGNATVLAAATGGSTVTGTGSMNWQGGALSGDLTLAAATLMDGGGIRHVPASSTLTNLNLLRVADNILQLDGTLVNRKDLRFTPSVQVLKADGTPGLLRNEAAGSATPAVLSVGAQDTTSGSGLVRFVRISLENKGTVSVVGGTKLELSGDAPGPSTNPTVSRLHAGSVLRDPFTPSSGATVTAGSLVVGRGASLGISGTVDLQGRGTLLLDDTSGGLADGTAARVYAADQPARLLGADAGSGFGWNSGTVVGPLKVEKSTTTVNSNSSKRLLTTTDAAQPALTLAGPAALNATKVTLGPDAAVLVTATTSVASSPSGFDRSTGQLQGQKVTVANGGTLKKTSQAPSSFSTGPGTFDVPVVNHGTVTLETSAVFAAGYTQSKQAGVADSAPTPLTGLISSTTATGSQLVTLSTGTGAGPFAPMTITAGGLGGVGKVATPDLKVSNAWVHPGFNATSGTMTVQGNLTLGEGADVQIVLRGSAAADQDKLEVVPLTHTPTGGATTTLAPGKATLDGRITTMSVNGYAPAYGTSVPGRVVFASRTGTFDDAAWSGTPAGLGWRPGYTATQVDVTFTDTAAPSLGLAGIPAFTQLTSQRITWSAVDNKSGVKSYDVRWQYGSPTLAMSPWKYPGPYQGTTATSMTMSVGTGNTYCWSVRVRDTNGNTSPWSQPLCTSKMHDDRSVAASSKFQRFTGQRGWYGWTFSRTTTRGAEMALPGVHRRIAVTAYRCPTCGVIEVYTGSTRIATLNLAESRSRRWTWVSHTFSPRNAPVRIRVVSPTGKLVAIDAVGALR